jgi:ComF family protein
MLCARCGAFHGDKAAPATVYCHKCDEHQYERAFAIGVYEKALAVSILALKQTPNISPRLQQLIAEAAARLLPWRPEVVLPSPLSKTRILERGFNQAAVIAKVAARSLSVPVDEHSLGRRTHTPVHRIGMDQRARELTVEKAFEVLRPKLISGKKILLIDDVLTSGSTASFCAKALKKAGASEVVVFTIARAVMR